MSVSYVINSSFLVVFSFPFSQWNGGRSFSAGHRDQELEEQINPPWVASLRLVSCGSASLSSLSVGAGSTAVGRARGLFSLTPLELDTDIHPQSQRFLPWSLCLWEASACLLDEEGWGTFTPEAYFLL